MSVRLEVRCCCQPQKIFGTLEVPDDRAWDGGSFEVPIRRPEGAIEVETIRIRGFSFIPGEWDVAVYSDDRPLEFWRQIPTFKEARCR